MNLQFQSDEFLHAAARRIAETLAEPDRKQLRFNEIFWCAKTFYAMNVIAGIVELVRSCDKTDALYVKGSPMWETLKQQYGWMIE